jgi:hypothetical protein
MAEQKQGGVTPPASRLSEERLREIERLAAAATPGPWRCDTATHDGSAMIVENDTIRIALVQGARNGPFIALANPATVAQLARELLELREVTRHLVQDVDAVRAGKLHINLVRTLAAVEALGGSP